jgi:hypothetical protein
LPFSILSGGLTSSHESSLGERENTAIAYSRKIRERATGN